MSDLNLDALRPARLPRVIDPSPSVAEQQLVSSLDAGLSGLPVLPSVASEALALAGDPGATIGRMTELVQRDPPLAARVLATANSALYSRGTRLVTLHDAVVRIGIAGCRDLMLMAVYASMLRRESRFYAEISRSYHHGVLCGLVARAACGELSVRYRDAYLVGLLHDIGEARVYSILEKTGVPLAEHEADELVERYHARAGAELARSWELPPDIAEVCALHHQARRGDALPVRLAAIADSLAPLVEASSADAASELPAGELVRLGELGVDGGQAASILETATDFASRM